jgi:hypothetical protein
MSIWISKAANFTKLLAAGLLLLACLPTKEGEIHLAQKPYTVLGGGMNVAVPLGYCLDRSSLVEKHDTFVALAGRCVNTASHRAAVISIAVGQKGTAVDVVGNEADLKNYVKSADGLAALSNIQKTSRIAVISAKAEQKVFVLHLQNQTPDAKSGLQSESWRAIFGISGRLVTVSVKGSYVQALQANEGFDLLQATVVMMHSIQK